MDKRAKNRANPSGITPQKLILIGVLAVILVAVLYLQFGRSGTVKPTASKPSAARDRTAKRSSAARRATNESMPTTKPRRSMGSLSRWKPPELSTVVEYDPFALPASFPQPEAAASAEAIAAAAATPEDAAKQQAALEQETQRMQTQLDTLRRQGVVVLLKRQEEFVAVIGDQELHVGDEFNGFRVVAIDSDGVQLAWEPN